MPEKRKLLSENENAGIMRGKCSECPATEEVPLAHRRNQKKARQHLRKWFENHTCIPASKGKA